MKNPIAAFVRLVRTIERAKREGRTSELVRAAREQAKLQKLMQRPRRYETINGTGEMGWGLFILCMALASYASVILPDSMGPWRSGISGLLFIGGMCAMPVCLWASKKFVTEPRVGYVAFRRGKAWWLGIIIAVVVGGMVSLILSRLLRPEMIRAAQSQIPNAGVAAVPGIMSPTAKIILAGFGPLNAVFYLMMNAVSIKEHRWKWLVMVLILLGPMGICFMVPGSFIEVSRPVMLFLGLMALCSGVVTLGWFLRHHQPPAPEAA